MSLVSPRKIERIHKYDVILHDLLADAHAVHECCDAVELNESVVGYFLYS